MMPSGMSAPPEPAVPMPGTVAASGTAPIGGPLSGEAAADGRKAKRELSQSKRAAQNRAAQRAFRQRKEGYIKKLEQQVRDYADIENNFKALQAENYNLREYVINLQSRLLDVKADLPPPPANVNLNHPHPGPPSVALPPHPEAQGGPGNSAITQAGNPLAQVAQAVAELGAGSPYVTKGFKQDAPENDVRTAEEIARQLEPDGLS